VTDLDMDLKRAFDRRLAPFTPPTRAARPRASRTARVLLGTALATLIFAGAGLAMDVQSVAAANGGGCVNLVAKLEMWVKKVTGELTTLDLKTHLAKIAREDGCEGPKTVDPSLEKNGPNHKAIEIPPSKAP
jgi:hypothetical protein